MATRYARETGRNWPRFNKPTDPQSIQGLALVRRSKPGSVARLTYYPSICAKAFRPTLGALVAAERRIARPASNVHPLFADMFRTLGLAA